MGVGRTLTAYENHDLARRALEPSPGRESWVGSFEECSPLGRQKFLPPSGLTSILKAFPGLTSWAKFCRPDGLKSQLPFASSTQRRE